MKLLVKFNLMFLLIFLAGLAGASLVARALLQEVALQDAASHARRLIEKADAVGAYTADQVSPLLEIHLRSRFTPQVVSAFAAAEVLALLQKNAPEYSYKAAMLNPTNPRDSASDWEEDLIGQFRNTPDLKESVGQRDTPAGASLYVARPIRIADRACLACHTTPELAPHSMVERYGPSNGFGWKLGETLGAQIVTVPLEVPMRRARQALAVVVGLLAAVFLALGAALNLMLWSLVIRPVSRLSAIADRVSMGEQAAEFETGSRDEIGVLSASFGRMRRSLEHAMAMLDT